MDLILYNPKSKNSRSNVQTHRLVRYYKKNHIPFRLKSILKINDIKKFLIEKTEVDKVILLGGDGTINRLVNNLVNVDIKQTIYIKKNGSGNDYLRTLKIQDEDSQMIMKSTLDNKVHYFINGCGVGIDGLVIDYVDKAKNKGKLTYMFSTLRAMLKYEPDNINCKFDDEEVSFTKAYSVMINNGKYIGGGMKITPNACINDDKLDVVVIHSISKFLILFIFLTVYLGLHTKFKRYVYSTKCKEVHVEYESPQIAQTDGEKFENITNLHAIASNHTIHLKQFKKHTL